MRVRSEYNRRYRLAHYAELQEYNRQWQRANLDKVRAKNRKWCQANPDKTREVCRRYAARKKGAAIEAVDEAAIYKRDGHMCMYCGTTHGPLELDHIEALNDRGPHCEDNLVVACRRCNGSKRAMPLEEWLLTQERALVWVL